MGKKGLMRKFLLKLVSLCALLALVVLAASGIGGCSIVERVKYELTGAGRKRDRFGDGGVPL